MNSYLFLWKTKFLWMEFTIQGGSVLLKEQIPSLNSWPQLGTKVAKVNSGVAFVKANP